MKKKSEDGLFTLLFVLSTSHSVQLATHGARRSGENRPPIWNADCRIRKQRRSERRVEKKDWWGIEFGLSLSRGLTHAS